MKKVKQLLLMLCALLMLSSMIGCSDDTPTEQPTESNTKGYEYVDLGLPSGLLWATCNVGATNPEDYGDYFAWGEIKTKSEYTRENSVTYNKEMEDISGNVEYDAARANWDGTWRMPTDTEMRELITYCSWEWTSQNGVNGYKITGANGNNIFLPAAGVNEASPKSEGSSGYYWSSTPNKGYINDVFFLYFASSIYYRSINNFRQNGCNVRPVTGAKHTSFFKELSEPTGLINNHGYVDLGLPSGLLWATCNIGASNSEDYGNYYAWGEIETKSDYFEESYVIYVKEMGDISGNAEYDAARANWGGTWRMPTNAEFTELRMNCYWEWISPNGVNGYKVTGPNGNSIFLPAAGSRQDLWIIRAGCVGNYWSSTPNEIYKNRAIDLYIYSGGYSYSIFMPRWVGLSVRPVSGPKYISFFKEPSEPTGLINNHGYVDLGLPSGLKWATCNVGATNPMDYGNYYAWGEIKTKSDYTQENSSTYGKEIGDISGNANYDAARANWGETWRMPTLTEIDELIDNCQWGWMTLNGIVGYNVTGPNGNSIFLPAAGYRYGSSLSSAGSGGYYWSSTPYEGYTNDAYYLYFYSSDYYRSNNYRNYGRSVRPVSE